MAQEDFYGNWTVLKTAGTNFGCLSRVNISASPAGGTQVAVSITPSFPSTTLAVTCTMIGYYQSGTDAIKISDEAQTTFISRFADAAATRYLYALAIGTNVMTVWTAKTEGIQSATPGNCTPPSFVGSYRVGVEVDSQFGITSPVEVTFDPTTQEYAVTVTNVLFNQPVPGPSLVFDSSTCSLHGATPVNNMPVVLQVSWASLNSRNYLYGLTLVDDPEQAGGWGAEDDGIPP